MSAPADALRRTGLIAASTLRETLRQRTPALLAALAAALAGGAWLLRDLNFGAPELRFLIDAGLGAEAVFGAMLAVVVTTRQFFAALDRGSAQLVLARPVRRAEYVAGHLGGVLLLLLGFCLLLTLWLAALLWWRETGLSRADPGAFAKGQRVPYAGLAWAGLAQWLRLAVLAAVTLFLASQARNGLFAMLAGFGALIAGQLQHLARDCFGAAASPWLRCGAWLLGAVVPDLHRFDLADQVTAGGSVAFAQIASLAGGAAVYVAAFGILAACCFQRRDL